MTHTRLTLTLDLEQETEASDRKQQEVLSYSVYKGFSLTYRPIMPKPSPLTVGENQGLVSPLAGDKDSQLAAKRFLKEFSEDVTLFAEFRGWWSNVNSFEDRCEFIRQVYPVLVHSLDDRFYYGDGDSSGYSIIDKKFVHRPSEGGVARRKIRTRDYERYNALAPHMTVVGLSTDPEVLPGLIVQMAKDSYLIDESREMATSIRVDGNYPLSPKERKLYEKEKKVKRGDIVYMARNDRNDASEEGFGSLVSVNEPATLINGSGTTMVGSHKVNLYEWCFFQHPTEFREACANLSFQLHAVTAFVQEFLDEIATTNDKDTSGEEIFKTCAGCHKTGAALGAALQLCSSCEMTRYCSTACQKAHFEAHKLDCVAMKKRREGLEKSRKSCSECGNLPLDGRTLMLCGRCKLTRYCDISCQRAHWASHKQQCKSK